METRDLLIYFLGYLNGLKFQEKIPSTSLVHIERLILNHKFPDNQNEENQSEYDSDYEDSRNEDSLYNRPDYNHDMDIDQQGADFDF